MKKRLTDGLRYLGDMRGVANRVSKAIILSIIFVLVTSAVWKAYHDACRPERYWACGLRHYFYFRWFYNYQTLITGLLALTGAWWGVRAIHAQMRQEVLAEESRLESRRAAARATLPLSLSLLSEYAEECTVILRGLLNKCVDGALPHSVKFKGFPSLPSEAIQAFKEMTEVSLPGDRETLATILTKIQIQRSRISAITAERRPPDMIVAAANLEEYILDAAEIYARSAALYEYARRKSQAIPSATISVDAQIGALSNLGVFDELRDKLVATLRRRNQTNRTA
ncbi:hypothetical protein [Mesorhizobium sp. WSM3873]|uniref:hypothetical protein n=1 Tax=Mesorhizobium sp. WSM3873 TaxID=1854056 RepID=UPI0008020048|nr:hypothetical protein [Mesorhizobium sp. WSM3873]OBQ87499.1 hypothetical protein A9K71_14750 [Mesorhizobium sp. WSM3873]